MLKLIILIGIGYLVYKLFFNKKKNNSDEEYELIECSRCGTYTTKKEAIFSNGKYYCSKECLKG